MVIERIGVDVGSTADLAGPGVAERREARMAAAAALGARLVRMRFALDGRRVVDEAFLADARAAVASAAKARLRVLAVIDGSLTVAPDAMADDASGAAAAWAEELAEHAARLAGALGEQVAAWEIVPGPNQAAAGRATVSPARWAALLDAVGGAVRGAAPGATIVSGALASTPDDDAVDYLRAAVEAGRWSVGPLPFDVLGLRLRLLPEGGVDEASVAAAVAERTGRVWRAAVAALGRHAAELRALWVTGLSWDAEDAGDAIQARNLWTAFDTLTADPNVGAVVWAALSDDGAANGLFAGADLAPASARPAWKAFNDFTQYARQIGGAPALLFDPDTPSPLAGLDDGGDTAGELVDAFGAPADGDNVGAAHVAVEDVDVGHADPVQPVAAPDDGARRDVAPPPAPAGPAPAGSRVRLHVPTVGELLTAAGVAAPDLERALANVEARHGSRDWLPPGDYDIDVDRDAAAAAPVDAAPHAAVPAPGAASTGPTLTNQHVLSAFYRAGGGSWTLLQRAGLDLADLVSQRDEPYHGAPIAQMATLSTDERTAVLGELGEAT